MEQLLTDIESFCQRHDLAESRFGELALNDKPFVSQLRKGRRLWPDTQEKVRAFMASYDARAEA